MGTVYRRGKIWYINAIAGKRRIRKRIGTSKKLAEMALRLIGENGTFRWLREW